VCLHDQAPDFKAESTQGKISLHDYLKGHWGIIFSHPKGFTPICSTELGKAASMKAEWDKLDVKLIAINVGESVDTLKEWIKDINKVSETEVYYPVVADKDRKISEMYQMLDASNLDQAGQPLPSRCLYIVNPELKIQLVMNYPAPIGRNFEEVLRAVEALQLNYKYKVVTPSNWQRGQKVVIMPNVTDEEAKKLFPGGFHTLSDKSKLRLVECQQCHATESAKK